MPKLLRAVTKDKIGRPRICGPQSKIIGSLKFFLKPKTGKINLVVIPESAVLILLVLVLSPLFGTLIDKLLEDCLIIAPKLLQAFIAALVSWELSGFISLDVPP